MPLVRISHRAGHAEPFPKLLSTAVHDALVQTFNVPADDLFHVVTEHASGLVSAPQFLGVVHSDDLVFVQITCAEGRTVEAKKALYRAIVENIAATTEVRREDVVINLAETKRENWSFGNGIAQYV